MKKIRDWFSMQLIKNTSAFVLLAIILINAAFLVLAGATLYLLVPGKYSSFGQALFQSISMVLDAGFMGDMSQASVIVTVLTLIIIIIGMVIFTGATIGYATNILSDFLANVRGGNMRLLTHNHIVILNWNTRASEIINDMIYTKKSERIVVLVDDDKSKVEQEIFDRLSDTLRKERIEYKANLSKLHGFAYIKYALTEKVKNRLTIIVRQGDTYSTKSLVDISLARAKTVIILGKDVEPAKCAYTVEEETGEKGNAKTIKTLIQVVDFPVDEAYRDKQQIVVEVDDDWTGRLVETIIDGKRKQGITNIVPLYVHRILGQLLSQFSIIPELNTVYSTLFSNKGATFYSQKTDARVTEHEFYTKQITGDLTSIPLAVMDTPDGQHEYFMADSEHDVLTAVPDTKKSSFKVKLNDNYWMKKKSIIILGHNSRTKYLMEGFNGIGSEWNFENGDQILEILAIDDEKDLSKLGDYPYLTKKTIQSKYDYNKVYELVEGFIDSHDGRVSILILSDDVTATDDFDSEALTYLIYVQDIIRSRSYDRKKLDILVELIDPKNYDVVHSYNVNNVIISNRYISKMVSQIGNDESLYSFYNDILTYDDAGISEFGSKEIYARECSEFFTTLPGECNAAELVKAVYDASPAKNKVITLGYVDENKKLTLFSNNRERIHVKLTDNDKLIVFANH